MSQENKIGKTIANLRKKEKLTQLQLAEKLYVSDKAIGRWENGVGTPEISNLVELAKLFNVPIDYIVKGMGANGVEDTKNTQKQNESVDVVKANKDKTTQTTKTEMSDEKLKELLSMASTNNTQTLEEQVKTKMETSPNKHRELTKGEITSSIISMCLSLTILLFMLVSGYLFMPVYGNFVVLFVVFLISILSLVLAIKPTKKATPLSITAIIIASLNLIMIILTMIISIFFVNTISSFFNIVSIFTNTNF